jgi:DNA-binding transcriptional LysR family regulator
MLDWITCIKTFNSIVTSGSFAETSRMLHTTPSAISKRVAWLEDTIGASLFKRSTRKLHLTEAGEALHERSVPLLNEWNEIKSAINTQHNGPNGTLHLGVPIGFGYRHIIEMLPGFLEKYPNVKVDLKLSNCVTHLANEQIDLFVSRETSIQNKKSLVGEKITTMTHKVYASPRYIKEHSAPKTPEDLENHNCIILNCEGTNNAWELDGKLISVSGNLMTNNTTAAIAAAVSGIGIMCMCPPIVKKEIEQGKLIDLFPQKKMDEKVLFAFYPTQKFIPKKTTAFLEYMKAYFE